jgi:hypothetical protein
MDVRSRILALQFLAWKRGSSAFLLVLKSHSLSAPTSFTGATLVHLESVNALSVSLFRREAKAVPEHV